MSYTCKGLEIGADGFVILDSADMETENYLSSLNIKSLTN